MAVPDINDPRPAYIQIAEDLRQRMKDGALAPGTKLPPQRVLAGRYAVAAGTLRSALDVLASEGLISTQSTRGTFVLKEPQEQGPSPEYLQMMDVVRQLSERVEDLESRVGHLEDGQAPRP